MIVDGPTPRVRAISLPLQMQQQVREDLAGYGGAGALHQLLEGAAGVFGHDKTSAETLAGKVPVGPAAAAAVAGPKHMAQDGAAAYLDPRAIRSANLSSHTSALLFPGRAQRRHQDTRRRTQCSSNAWLRLKPRRTVCRTRQTQANPAALGTSDLHRTDAGRNLAHRTVPMSDQARSTVGQRQIGRAGQKRANLGDHRGAIALSINRRHQDRSMRRWSISSIKLFAAISSAPSGCRLDPHALHQRRDVAATGVYALPPQQRSQHTRSREGIIEMQLIEPTHQGKVLGRNWPRFIVDRAASQQRPGCRLGTVGQEDATLTAIGGRAARVLRIRCSISRLQPQIPLRSSNDARSCIEKRCVR
ncbi:hypothetical protein ACVMFA_007425 [Bradyrhizobium liaoningense]